VRDGSARSSLDGCGRQCRPRRDLVRRLIRHRRPPTSEAPRNPALIQSAVEQRRCRSSVHVNADRPDAIRSCTRRPRIDLAIIWRKRKCACAVFAHSVKSCRGTWLIRRSRRCSVQNRHTAAWRTHRRTPAVGRGASRLLARSRQRTIALLHSAPGITRMRQNHANVLPEGH